MNYLNESDFILGNSYIMHGINVLAMINFIPFKLFLFQKINGL